MIYDEFIFLTVNYFYKNGSSWQCSEIHIWIFTYYLRIIFRKTNLCYPLLRTRSVRISGKKCFFFGKHCARN